MAASQDTSTLLSGARAQIEEFAYDSAYKLLVRVLNAPGQLPTALIRANTLYAINELNRLADGKQAARGAFLEALRLDPKLVIDSLAHLHSDAKAVFAAALDLAPPAIKSARAALPVAKATPPPVRADPTLPPSVPVSLPARVVKISERALRVDDSFYEETPNLLDRPCSAFMGLFWDVLGYEIDPPRLCTLSVVLSLPEKSGSRQLLNYTRFTRRKDGAIEADLHPATVGEWFNESTGKRLQFNIRGDTVLVTDLTPSVPLSKMPPRKTNLIVNTRIVMIENASHTISSFESQGAPLPVVRDALPMELSVSHAHRRGACEGKLTFDGDNFRYVSMQSGGHAFRFTIDDVTSGSFSQEIGVLLTRAVGGEERFAVSTGWTGLLSAIVKSRRH